MDQGLIKTLIDGGETLVVEFKSERTAPVSDRDLVETVVCLANRSGEDPGWLLLGVEDDGRVTGARPRHESGRTDTLRVQALIGGRTRPALTVRADLVPLRDRHVLVIEVPPARQPVGTADGRYLRRALGGDGKPACIPFHFHEMQSQQAQRGVLDYTALRLSDLGLDALDPLEFERYRRTIREYRVRGDQSLLGLDDLDLAKALGAVDIENGLSVRVLGLLLFGKEDALAARLPTHEVAFQVLTGLEVEANEFFRWPLLRTFEELNMRFRARVREREIYADMIRIGVPNYSLRAFREAVANALAHRDYTRPGATHVQWHDDRLTVSNPGGLPDGVRLDNILVTQPRPRNPLLADAFKRAGLVERTARGVDTIFYEQLRNGRAAPRYQTNSDTDVTLTLPGGEADLRFVRLVAEEGLDDRPLPLGELLILRRLRESDDVSAAEAARLVQKEEAETVEHLQKLVERRLVTTRGSGTDIVWRLSAATSDRLRDPTARA